MDTPARTFVLCDASLPGLVGCAFAAEEHALSGVRGDPPGTSWFAPLNADGSSDAARRIATRLNLEWRDPPRAPARELAASAGHDECNRLLAAAYAAAVAGYDRIVWPATAGAGDSLDIDRIAQIADRALLVGRLVAVDTAAHRVPGFRIETPFADFTDRQIADLVLDMEVAFEDCWWHTAQGSAAAAERDRWLAALEAVGWRAPAAG